MNPVNEANCIVAREGGQNSGLITQSARSCTYFNNANSVDGIQLRNLNSSFHRSMLYRQLDVYIVDHFMLIFFFINIFIFFIFIFTRETPILKII